MDESEEKKMNRTSRSRRKRQLEKSLTTGMEYEEAGENGEEKMVRASADRDGKLAPPPPGASLDFDWPSEVEATSKKTEDHAKATTSADDRVDGLCEASEELGASVPKKIKKKRRKKTKRIPEDVPPDEESLPPHTILRDVVHLKDDVVEAVDFVPAASAAAARIWYTNINANSQQATGKLFVESRGAFKAMDKQKLMEASNASLAAAEDARRGDAPSSVDHGLRLHSAVKKVAACGQGMLAGLALMLCIVVYRLGPPYFSLTDFLQHYAPLAAIVQALFYLLITVSIDSLLARLNLGGEESAIGQLRRLRGPLVSLSLYLVSLLLSLSIADKDARLSSYRRNATRIGENEDTEDLFGVWRNVNFCRCLGVMAAWLVTASCASRDLMRNQLMTFQRGHESAADA